MPDNSLQNGTDTIRDLARQAGTVKTQTFQLDLGGPTANAEVLITAGQQAAAASVPVVLASDITASGTLAAAAQVVTLALSGQSAAAAQLTGSWVGTITFEASLDGTTWTALNAVSASTSFPQTTTNANGLFRITPAGLQQFRANMTGFTSGSASVILRASTGVGGTFANQILPTKITDGVSTQAIKAASTAAVAADAAAVVALSPNSPLVSVTTVGTLTTLANGQTAHSSASTGSPVRVAGRVNTAVDTTLVAGDASDFFMTTSGAVVQKPFSAPELDWQFAGAAGGIINTTDVVLKAAGAAGVRNYLTGISVQNASATVSTEVVVKDAATVIWRGFVGTSAILNSAVSVPFPTPLRGSAAAALNVACITTGAAVYVNAQGYQAP